MTLGIDTFRAHLDLLPTIFGGGDFFASNGNARPIFAGRNFLGGSFLWGHGEATNALQDPSPGDLTQLNLNVPLIAPMQAPSASRQQVTGEKGHLYGKIDGEAICKRLEASILTGEFLLPVNTITHIWLGVDSTAPLSADYWAGWADRVNQYAYVNFNDLATYQPFRACINCTFTIGVTGKLQPHDNDVLAGIVNAWKTYKGSHALVYAFWAETMSNQPLDWTRFSGVNMPLLWRFAKGFRNNAGVLDNSFDLDATNSLPVMKQHAIDFMLRTTQWQPSLNGVVNLGFSSTGAVGGQANCLATANVPAQTRIESCGRMDIRSGPVISIGRYVRASEADSFSEAEATLLSAKPRLGLFTVFERGVVIAGVGGPTSEDYYDPDNNTGLLDGRIAFPYCANKLHQPPQTHIFFAIDWTPPGENDDSKKPWIQGYASGIKQAYDEYIATHPNRPYLIGIYGSGRPLRWLYEQGIVSGFWQAGSMCQIESAPPRWPWPHATRWQYMVSPPSNPKICGIGGEDLDADWGDGGTWSYHSQLAQELLDFELRAAVAQFRKLFPTWANLLDRIAGHVQ